MKWNRTMTFLTALFVVCLAFSYRVLAPFFGPAMLALLFAIAFAPMHHRITLRIRKPGMAALASTVLIYVVILLPLGIAVALLAGQVSALVAQLSQASQTEGGMAPFLAAEGKLVIDWIAPRLHMSEDDLMREIVTRAQETAQTALAGFAGMLVGAGSAVADFLLASVMLFFFLRDGEQIRAGLLEMMPLAPHDAEELLGVVHATVTANVYGVVGVAMVQGVLTTLGLMMMQVPSALTWGAMATLAAFIPLVGPPLVWVPIVIWLISQDRYGAAAALAFWCVVVVGLADNLLRPLLVGGQTNQHALLVFLSLLGGTAAFGVMGLFLGPLLISVTIAVFKVLRREASA